MYELRGEAHAPLAVYREKFRHGVTQRGLQDELDPIVLQPRLQRRVSALRPRSPGKVEGQPSLARLVDVELQLNESIGGWVVMSFLEESLKVLIGRRAEVFAEGGAARRYSRASSIFRPSQ
jgi:hypothetical protein